MIQFSQRMELKHSEAIMDANLTQDDIRYIWQVLHQSAKSVGGYEKLISAPLEFFEDNNRVQFKWPVWMRDIKSYLSDKYQEDTLDTMLIDVFAEIYNPQNYETYLNSIILPSEEALSQHQNSSKNL